MTILQTDSLGLAGHDCAGCIASIPFLFSTITKAEPVHPANHDSWNLNLSTAQRLIQELQIPVHQDWWSNRLHVGCNVKGQILSPNDSVGNIFYLHLPFFVSKWKKEGNEMTKIQAKLRSSLSAQNLLSFHKQDGMSFKGWVNIMINGRTTTFICLHCKNTQQRPSSHSVVGFHIHLLSSFLWGWNELERNAVDTMSLVGRRFKPFPFEYMPQMSSTGSTCDLCPPPIGVRLVLKIKIG